MKPAGVRFPSRVLLLYARTRTGYGRRSPACRERCVTSCYSPTASGRMCGNRSTSRIDWRVGQEHHQPVDADAQAARSAACRTPARGCSRRRSTSPPRRRPPCASTCAWKRAAWSSGSLSSEKPLAISRAADEELEAVGDARIACRCARDSGDTSAGIVGDEGRLRSGAVSTVFSKSSSCSLPQPSIAA